MSNQPAPESSHLYKRYYEFVSHIHRKTYPMHRSTMWGQTGLTLIEVLIVVILMGIIAAVAIPQFTTATTDAQNNALNANLATLRTTIDLYAAQHNGRYPGQYLETTGATATTSDPLAATAFVAQLTQYSDATGKVSLTKDPLYPYGPYFRSGMPKNPLPASSNTVVADFATVATLVGTVAAGQGGWKVAVQTGQVIANHAAYETR